MYRVSRSLKKGQGGHSEKGHMVHVESFEKGIFCARAREVCIKDKRGISNIMWKSTSILVQVVGW